MRYTRNMNYTPLASIALFILVARNHEKLSPSFSALAVVGGPFLLNLVTLWIAYGYDFMSGVLFSFVSLVTLTLQFIAALVLFYQIKKDFENLTLFFAWVAIGWPAIFLLIPWMVRVVF